MLAIPRPSTSSQRTHLFSTFYSNLVDVDCAKLLILRFLRFSRCLLIWKLKELILFSKGEKEVCEANFVLKKWRSFCNIHERIDDKKWEKCADHTIILHLFGRFFFSAIFTVWECNLTFCWFGSIALKYSSLFLAFFHFSTLDYWIAMLCIYPSRKTIDKLHCNIIVFLFCYDYCKYLYKNFSRH